MNIDVLAFGIAREIVGGGAIVLQVDEAATVGALRARLQQRYPELQRLTSFAIAVNGAYADAYAIIKPGDEIAIIPPVSGG